MILRTLRNAARKAVMGLALGATVFQADSCTVNADDLNSLLDGILTELLIDGGDDWTYEPLPEDDFFDTF